MKNEAMDFDLSVVEIPVTITKKDGTKKECLLREASGDTVCKFNNARTTAMRYGPEGNVSGYHNINDVGPLLVSLCMVELERGPDGSVTQERPVQITEVRSWPNRVSKSLFEEAKRISDIDDDSEESLLKQRDEIDKQLEALRKKEETAKNDESNMTDGSD